MKVINAAVMVQQLVGFPDRLAQTLSGVPREYLTVCLGDEWSVTMVVTHLMHCEAHFRARFDRIAREDNPFLPTFGPELASPHSDLPFAVVMNHLRDERRQTMFQIYEYTGLDWQRPAHHEIGGTTTLSAELQRVADHDLEHLGQIHDILQTIKY